MSDQGTLFETPEKSNGNGNGAKRGRISGGAATLEALSSSQTILNPARGNKAAFVGLQQYFSPPEAAELIGRVMSEAHAVLDPQAGDGALLSPFPEECRYGIEIDSDHAKAGSYNAITGDSQGVVPMLRAAGIRFPAIALNPPFGLSWGDPAHSRKAISSTSLSFLWALDLMSPLGQGAMVCGTGRLGREVMALDQAAGIYAVADVEGELFPGVDLECSVAFFVRPQIRRGEGEPLRGSSPLGELPDLAYDIREARNRAAGVVSPMPYNPAGSDLGAAFEGVASEHRRRVAVEEGRRKSRYDLTLSGAKISVGLSAYAKLALAETGKLRSIELLNGHHRGYFALNSRAWRQIEAAEEQGIVTVDPALRGAAEKALQEGERHSTPLFPLRPQMRLGWLSDLDSIRCVKSDAERGFVAGEDYTLSTESKVSSERSEKVVDNKYGEPELRRFVTERRLLEVAVGDYRFDEGPENISYLSQHFDLPDPGDVAQRFPEEVERNRRILSDIESDNGFTLKPFQKDHLSRLLVKRRGMLAMEQGLGKTLLQMALAEATVRLGAKNQVLFVAPQDIIRQWQKESWRFFGRRMEVIRTPAQARDVARRIEAGETGWWITYYEALSLVGRKEESLPTAIADHRADLSRRLADYKLSKGASEDDVSELAGEAATAPTTKDACPRCMTDTRGGWNGEVCGVCGYVHRRIWKKAAYSHLTKAFERGVVLVDEVSEIRGDDSLRSKAIRGLARGPHRYGATGTPVSNFITDSFWGLYFCLGDSSIDFPYGHDDKPSFEADFAVVENMMGEEDDGEGNVKKRKKILPKVTNVSQFWRLTQPSVSRCRKEATGEPLVERIYHPIRVPMGEAQKQDHEFWLSNFEEYFTWKHPDHNLVKEGLVEKFAAALGQLWRLESAATLPREDGPSREWPKAAAELPDLSNYTPASLKVLELAAEHVANGEKVLIGSDLIATGKWMSQRLSEKGIRAVHITEERNGELSTKDPRKRAREVEDFVSGDAAVLCAGVNALKLGHNLDVASTVLLSGLPWSYMVLDQFLARVHRLTSEREVNVYVVIPRGSLAEQKWKLLCDKGDASDLAFDGELQISPEKPTDWSAVLSEMKERGLRADEETLSEADLEAEWEARTPLEPPAPQRPPAPKSPPSEIEEEYRQFFQESLF